VDHLEHLPAERLAIRDRILEGEIGHRHDGCGIASRIQIPFSQIGACLERGRVQQLARLRRWHRDFDQPIRRHAQRDPQASDHCHP